MSFEKELENLINRHSKENDSNTPDFILAQYISGCLATFATATQQRETWYGRDARPSQTHNEDQIIGHCCLRCGKVYRLWEDEAKCCVRPLI